MCRSRRELSNEYFLAKIGVDTAENEPLEVLGENSIQYSLNSLDAGPQVPMPGLRRRPHCRGHPRRRDLQADQSQVAALPSLRRVEEASRVARLHSQAAE